ncbi:hypothetical protein Y032_0112g306 [Ancylostoma ceylanicum]|uniref:Uncharacterized protein n=1 Tax=Ancylostoma ceylanicum TaxID=53326 RepID=A0A016TDT5_9BILA|nr:hypothetical protein Y032_0112g306 [Ancylostoma ceylanicum]
MALLNTHETRKCGITKLRVDDVLPHGSTSSAVAWCFVVLNEEVVYFFLHGPLELKLGLLQFYTDVAEGTARNDDDLIFAQCSGSYLKFNILI